MPALIDVLQWIAAAGAPFLSSTGTLDPAAMQGVGAGFAFLVLLGLDRRRWQMLPVPVSLLLVLIAAFTNSANSTGGAVTMLILTLVSVVADLYLPIPPLLPHKGPYPVGELTLSFSRGVTPETRAALAKNKFDDDSDFSKPPKGTEVTFKIWYPAVAPTLFQRLFARRGWFFPRGGLALAALLKVGVGTESAIAKALFSHMSRSRSHAIVGLPVSQAKKWPLLLFSHGLTGIPENYTSCCAPVASYGYIVAAPVHSDGTASQNFAPDGFEIPYNSWVDDDLPPKPQIWRLRNWGQTQRVEDLRFILEGLSAASAGDPGDIAVRIVDDNKWPRATAKRPTRAYAHEFRGSVDTSRVGVFGHSFGGCTVYEALAQDSRFRGGVAYDPYLLPLSAHQLNMKRYNEFRGMPEGTPPPPLMVVPSELWQWDNSIDAIARAHKEVYSNNPQSLFVTLLGSRHHNFSDICNLAERITNARDVSGPIPAHVGLQTLAEAVVSFFGNVMPPTQTAEGGAVERKPLLQGADAIPTSKHMRVESTEYIEGKLMDKSGWAEFLEDGNDKPGATFKLE